MHVTHEFICGCAYNPDGQSQSLTRYSPQRQKKSEPRYTRLQRRKNLLERSFVSGCAHIKTPVAPGEWEGDPKIVQRERREAIRLSRGWRKIILFKSNLSPSTPLNGE